jgi:hypothetical protein
VEALVHVIVNLVAALAATAFAHFGVTLKTQPQPTPEQTIRRVPVSDPAPGRASVTHAVSRPIVAQTERT